jgi:hypothetical protein
MFTYLQVEKTGRPLLTSRMRLKSRLGFAATSMLQLTFGALTALNSACVKFGATQYGSI